MIYDRLKSNAASGAKFQQSSSVFVFNPGAENIESLLYICVYEFLISKEKFFLQKNQNFWLTLKEQNGFNENIHIFIYCDVPFKSWFNILF